MYHSVHRPEPFQSLRQRKPHLLLIGHMRLDGQDFAADSFESLQAVHLFFRRL